jgi:hypothetical protein
MGLDDVHPAERWGRQLVLQVIAGLLLLLPTLARAEFICHNPTGAVVRCTQAQTDYWTNYNAGVQEQCAKIAVADPVADRRLLAMLRYRCLQQQQMTVR